MADSLSNLSDHELLTKLRLYNNDCIANPPGFGLTAAEAVALQGDLDGFEDSLNEWDAINVEYDSKLETKEAKREAALLRGRQQRRITRAKAGDSNELLAAAGMSAYDDIRTPSASPSSVPFALVDFGNLRHTINFRDKATPDTN